MKKRIWDSRLWIRLGLDESVNKNAAFGANKINESYLGAQLLLYDKITIPTLDFGIVPQLVKWCGMNGLTHLLQYDALSFAWMDMMPGYAGGGGGLKAFAVGEPDGGWQGWNQVARWAPMAEAAEAQLLNSIPDSWTKNAKYELLDLVLQESFEAETKKITEVRQETINDVSSVVDLNSFIRAAEGNKEEGFYFNNLSNVPLDKFRVVGNDVLNDAVDLVLRVAEVNTELMAARASGDCDLGLQFGAPQLLVEKMKRCGASEEQLLNFTKILDLNQMPDIRPAIEAGAVSLHDIAGIRTTDNAEKFREWMRNADANDADDIVKIYHSATEQLNSKSWPVKLTRIISTAGVGVLGGLAALPLGPVAASAASTVAGTLAATVDSFFVDDWINGYNPSLFVNELRKLPLDDPSTPDY